MIVIAVFLAVFVGLALISTVHALGAWLVLMIIHGMLVLAFGDVAVHLPLYTGLAVAVGILARSQWTGVPTTVLLLFGALILVMLLAGFQGLSVDNSLFSMIAYVKGFLVALLLAGCLKDERAIKMMMLYCLAGLLIGALFTLYQYKTGTFTISDIYDQRAAGLRGDPNDTAMLLVGGIPLAAYWIFNAKGILMRGGATLAFLLLVVGIVLTESRGGFVALVLIALVLYWKRPSILMTIAGLVLSLSIFVYAPDTYIERLETLITGVEPHHGYSMQNRKALQQKGIDIFLNHPVLGVGPGNFGNAFQSDERGDGLPGGRRLVSEKGGSLVAHNMYLEFFAENGLIGGMLWLMIFLRAMYGLIRYDRQSRLGRRSVGLGFSLSVALCGMMFAGLFLSQGQNSVLWFMVGLGLAAGQAATKLRQAPITKAMVATSLPNQRRRLL